jgi:hypothetical protein
MGSASGVYKQCVYKKETTYGVQASSGGGQSMRRTSLDLSLKKDSYKSNEVRQDLQIADLRHGTRRVPGKVGGELSPKTWADFLGTICKRAFTVAPSITGATITVSGTGPYTLTRQAGSFLSDGFKVGHIGRLTAGGFNAANLNKNLFISSVTALAITVVVLNGSALVAEGPISGASFSLPGRHTWIPTTGHVEESYTIESFNPEVPSSECAVGCKLSGFSANLPPTGIAGIDFDVVGKDVIPAVSQYFTASTPVTTTGSLAAVNGIVRIAGAVAAVITGLTLQANGAYTGDPVVGSNTIPQQFANPIEVTGQLTAYFDSTTLRDAFFNESEIDIAVAFTSDNSAAADFVSFVLPRVKLTSYDKSDGMGAIIATAAFQSLQNHAGGTGLATEKTSLMIQDSAA